MAERKLDIFDVLKHIDMKDYQFYDGLPEDQQKAYVPYVIMRWMSGIKDPRQVVFLNELVNSGVFRIPNHKGLLHRLMCVCSSGKTRRYTWIKTPQRSDNMPTTTKLVAEYFNYSTSHACDSIPLLSDDDILQIAQELGTQSDILTKIKKELSLRRKAE